MNTSTDPHTEVTNPLYAPAGLEPGSFDLNALTPDREYAEREACTVAVQMGVCSFLGWTYQVEWEYAPEPEYWVRLPQGLGYPPEDMDGIEMVWRAPGTHPGGAWWWGSPAQTVLVPTFEKEQAAEAAS